MKVRELNRKMESSIRTLDAERDSVFIVPRPPGECAYFSWAIEWLLYALPEIILKRPNVLTDQISEFCVDKMINLNGYEKIG